MNRQQRPAGSSLRLSQRLVSRFLAEQKLPPSYAVLIDRHLLPLIRWIAQHHIGSGCSLLGINGAQGTGKSTLAAFAKCALEGESSGSIAVLSIDDFYLTMAERQARGSDVHPLLSTRGVPGTHDIAMLERCLATLRALRAGEQAALPRFDKATDDRAPESLWPTVTGPVELIVLEGWCVGSTPQTSAALDEPLNELERREDADGRWRRFVNDQLAGDYASLFARLDSLVFLQAPSFAAIYRWRLEQERKLLAATHSDSGSIMNEAQIAAFIQHYERVTRHNLQTLPDTADVTLELDEDHGCMRSYYRK